MNVAGLRLALVVLACAGWLTLQPAARADTIEFKSGQKIEGEVLKERPDELIVDIGVDILRIPTDAIKQRTQTGKSAAPAQVQQEEIYSMADLPLRSVKELSQQFGEGVVLIQTPSGLGSGFLLNEQGHCVTNYHVIEKETRIAVTVFHQDAGGDFARRRIDDVKILALNPFFDLALLLVPPQADLKFKRVFLARKDELREGDPVFAIGNPLGLERSVSQGIVSTRNRSFGGVVYIQTTAQINPGNSGGPLFNMRGEVVGVTNMKLILGEGLGFAIPTAYLKHFLQNQDAFAYDKTNANSGHRYLSAPRRRTSAAPPVIEVPQVAGEPRPAASAAPAGQK